MVCGTDGKTYDSICHLQSTKCDSETPLELEHEGVCGTNLTMTIGVVVIVVVAAVIALVGGIWYKCKNGHGALSQNDDTGL